MDPCTLTPLIEVAVPVNGVPNLLTYSVPLFCRDVNLVGKRVHVTVGNRQVVGVVVNDRNIAQASGFKIRDFHDVLDKERIVTHQQIKLCLFVSQYYFAPLGEVIRLCLPPDTPRTMKRTALAKRVKTHWNHDNIVSQTITLTAEQQKIVEAINHSNSFLLQGVTGSGKTEVYIAVARSILAHGKTVLVIVPEIALTPQLLTRFESQLGHPVSTIHSALTHAQRRETIFDLLKPEARVLVGTRSALFAPLHNLGLIIVDEEHDGSLKQDDTPRYHARDVALWRAKNENAKIILGSATPSLESIVNVQRGKLTLLKLNERARANSILPNVNIVDLKSRSQHTSHKYSDRAQSDGHKLCILSKPLQDALTQTLECGEQAMLFLNRRGYASFVLCDTCGVIVQCPFCSTSMTYYQQSAILRCNQCDFSQGLPKNCKACHETSLITLGLGTERVEKEVQMCFPNARIARLDRDVARGGGKEIKNLLNQMHDGNMDILIGTQMIAKGHDFARVSLVGVVLADTALSMPDFRATEKTFQLLTQVAGRAGRRETPGQVIIQTFNPHHPAIEFAKNHDVDGFIKWESSLREQAKQAPYVRSVLLRVESKNVDKTTRVAGEIRVQIMDAIERLKVNTECHLLGPAPAAIEKLREQYRWQLYLRTTTAKIRQDILLSIKAPKNVRLVIDVDPQSMM